MHSDSSRVTAHSDSSHVEDGRGGLEGYNGRDDHKRVHRPPKLRAVIIGAGIMGHWWARCVVASEVAELVGIADLSLDVAAEALAQSGHLDPASVQLGTDGVALAQSLSADIIINPTVPAAHHPITVQALAAGIPVLGEKPVTDTLPQAIALMAHAEATGTLFMVSQSRRYFRQVRQIRDFVSEHGPAWLTNAYFTLFTEQDGFRAIQEHPLLRDMGIHAFDAVRYMTGTEPVAVTAHGANPPWSTYAGDATVSCTFEMDGGGLFVYSGSWNVRGLATWWNSEWRVGCQRGSATWDGQSVLRLGTDDDDENQRLASLLAEDTVSELEQIDASLVEFCQAVRTGYTPMNEIHDNLLSFAMVEAAVASVDRGGRVVIDELLEEARTAAIAAEMNPRTREIMTSWSSVRDAIKAWPRCRR
ncbi:Gfo/Idh/MocA family protein [Devriesea agamarum]|uniref:Gfo/Idh/MocA family protein n=1 Tax=Devriesea agamarum TaxID=472569 RepID=UPI001E4C262A|nr:Gfo/Idh/MocA family oxidoreductase [Devriesea agamarum]